jgi:rhodanese-related sulfurtransferase
MAARPCRARVAAMGESMLSPWIAWALAQQGRIQLVDVRDGDERDLSRIPGVRAIPLEELPHELGTLDRERPVVFVSGRGRKAAEAMRVLRAAGVTTNAVAGGVYAWREAGLPLDNGPDSSAPPRHD